LEGNRSITREIKVDTEEIRNDTTAIRGDTTQIIQIVAEIARLQARLPEEERVSGANGFTMQRYLDNLTSYAESSWDRSDVGSNHSTEVGASHTSSPSLPAAISSSADISSPADISPPADITMTQMEALEGETTVMSSPPQNIGPPVPPKMPAAIYDTHLERETAAPKRRNPWVPSQAIAPRQQEIRLQRETTGASKTHSRAPSQENVPSQQGNTRPQAESLKKRENPVFKKTYNFSHPLDVEPENSPGINGHKRSNTIGGIFERTNSIFGGK
jgi:hypothetical protein